MVFPRLCLALGLCGLLVLCVPVRSVPALATFSRITPRLLITASSPLTQVIDPAADPAARYSQVVALEGNLFVIEQTVGEVRVFPLPTLGRVEQFSKVLRYREANQGLIIGRPLSMSVVSAWGQAGDVLVLDDRASLWSYDPLAQVRILEPWRVEGRQGALAEVAVDPTGTWLVALDSSTHRLWSYRITQRGFTGRPQPFGPVSPTVYTDHPSQSLVALSVHVALYIAAGTVWQITPSARHPFVLQGAPHWFHPAALSPVSQGLRLHERRLLVFLDPVHAALAWSDTSGRVLRIITLPPRWDGQLDARVAEDATTGIVFVIARGKRSVWGFCAVCPSARA